MKAQELLETMVTKKFVYIMVNERKHEVGGIYHCTIEKIGLDNTTVRIINKNMDVNTENSLLFPSKIDAIKYHIKQLDEMVK